MFVHSRLTGSPKSAREKARGREENLMDDSEVEEDSEVQEEVPLVTEPHGRPCSSTVVVSAAKYAGNGDELNKKVSHRTSGWKCYDCDAVTVGDDEGETRRERARQRLHQLERSRRE